MACLLVIQIYIQAEWAGYLSMWKKELFLLEFLPLLSNPYTASLCITAENPFLTCPLNLYTETGFWKGAVHKLRRLSWREGGMGKPQKRFTKKTPFKGQLISKCPFGFGVIILTKKTNEFFLDYFKLIWLGTFFDLTSF